MHVFALFYGDHEPLARRCLESIVRAASAAKELDSGHPEPMKLTLSLGFNNTCAATDETTKSLIDLAVEKELFESVSTFRSQDNIGKYPMMRAMFHWVRQPGGRVMWFDDDSFISYTGPGNWFRIVDTAFKQDAWTMVLGKIYRFNHPFNSHEWENIQKQSWFRGKPMATPRLFVTGGWWVADFTLLALCDYPFQALLHHGGDVILGEVVRQQGGKLTNFDLGVCINADDTGAHSTAAPRGLSGAPRDRRPVWSSPQAIRRLTRVDIDITRHVKGVPDAKNRITVI